MKITKNAALAGLGVVGILFLSGCMYMAAAFRSQLNTVKHQLAETTKAAKSDDMLRQEFYDTEVAALVSPHTLRLSMDRGEVDYVLVDVRSSDAYKAGHIRGAINIPPELNEQEKVSRFKAALADGKKLQRSYLILYCYSSSCTLARKTGQLLAAHGISAKELSIGYNEWAMQPDIWNVPGESVNISNYVQTGQTAGELRTSTKFLNRTCSINPAFSC
jgi:rhodanese-related sulfurtransferase